MGSGNIGGSTYSGSQVSWADEAGNTVIIRVAKSGSEGAGTGTFNIPTFENLQDGNVPDRYSMVVVTYNGDNWSPKSTDGNVEIVTNDGSRLVGTINNVILILSTSPDSGNSIKINGAFDIQR